MYLVRPSLVDVAVAVVVVVVVGEVVGVWVVVLVVQKLHRIFQSYQLARGQRRIVHCGIE